MSLKTNPLITLLEESIRFKESAQVILSEAIGGTALTRLERLILIAITESDVLQTAPQIGRTLGHSRQVVQKAANKLLELGLVRKLPNPDHKSAALFEPTAAGMKFEKQVGDTLEDIVKRVFTDKDLKLCERMARDIYKLRLLVESFEANTGDD